MPNLVIKLTLELTRPLVFHLWLPMETEEAIVIEEQNVHVTLYFTPKSTWWASQPTSEEIRRTFNNHAHRMFIEARVQISEALGNYIRSGSREVGSLADEYEALGRTWKRSSKIELID